jgi:ParB family chromosome partitioning protein
MTKETYEKGKLYDIPVSDLHADPNQPRKYKDKLEMAALKESIERDGLLQPVLFRQDEEGNLFIVSGERRFEAAKELEKETIQAMYTDGDPMELALIENLVREDLNVIDKAEALNRLMKENEYKNTDLAKMFGKSDTNISEILSLNNLHENIKNECRKSNRYALRRLKSIAVTNNKQEQLGQFRKYKEQLDKQFQKKNKKTPATKRNPVDIESKRIDSLKEKLSKKMDKWDTETKKELKGKIEELKDFLDDVLKSIDQ